SCWGAELRLDAERVEERDALERIGHDAPVYLVGPASVPREGGVLVVLHGQHQRCRGVAGRDRTEHLRPHPEALPVAALLDGDAEVEEPGLPEVLEVLERERGVPIVLL